MFARRGAMKKGELRKIWLAKRRELAAEDLRRLSGQVADTLFANVSFERLRVLHTFLPIEKFAEIDTWQAIKRVWRDFPLVTIVVPRLDETSGEMEAVRLTADTELTINKWGISEPLDGEIIPPVEIDAVLVPGLCFDRNGHRVGYGKGFYDRLLLRTRRDCRKIGLSVFDLVEDIEDVHEGDVPVDTVITPEAIWPNL